MTCKINRKICMVKSMKFDEIFDKIESICALLESAGQSDASNYRFFERSRVIAQQVIDQDAAFDKAFARKLIKNIRFSKASEERYAEHVKAVLGYFLEGALASRLFIRLTLPLANQWAEKLVRLSLGLDEGETLKSRHVRVAVMSAMLTPLRQTVGSCFATAPAIIVQKEQFDNLLSDLHELLTRGLLRRVISGREFKVPLSISSGSADLKKFISSPGKFHLHPGLILALERSEVFKKGEVISKIQSLFAEVYQKRPPANVEEFIRSVLQMELQVTDGDFDRAKAQPERSSPFLMPTASQMRMNKRIDNLKLRLSRAYDVYAHFSSHALLRAWEYTVASFTDYQDTSTKRNLTVGLGLEPEALGGIGPMLYGHVQGRLNGANEKVQEMHQEYVLAHDRVEMTQRLLANADSTEKARRLKGELSAHLHHMQACFDSREEQAGRAKQYAELFNYITKQYFDHFQLYFQELYDPDMQDVDEHLFEDSPAGFRLVYKHGRAEPSVWTPIHSEKEYIQSLRDFFLITEPLIVSGCDWEHAGEEIPEMTQLVLAHIETEEFMQSAYQRIVDMHRRVSNESAGKKPWSYISGGTIETLLNCYYSREGEISVEKFSPKNPTELCIFLIDLMKEMPLQIVEKSKRLLMVSPNHAFVMLPQCAVFKRGWESDQFTYTWVRDNLIEAHAKYYSETFLSQEEQTFLVKRLYQKFPHLETKTTKFYSDHLSLTEFAKEFPSLPPSEIAAFLKNNTPLISKEQIEILCDKLGLAASSLPDFLNFQELIDFLIAGTQKDENDIEAFLQLSGYTPPKPLIFADTNWPDFYFAFQINPLTHELELWRTGESGWTGYPMVQWAGLFTGNSKHYWGVFVRPFEYGGTYVPVPSKLYV